MHKNKVGHRVGMTQEDRARKTKDNTNHWHNVVLHGLVCPKDSLIWVGCFCFLRNHQNWGDTFCSKTKSKMKQNKYLKARHM